MWFVPEAFEFVLRATNDPEHPYLLILDEMNLAHVERYFSDFLSGAMNNAVGTMKAGEQMATQQVAGQADIVDVVNSVNSAELTLDTVMAVRDKVIAAYQTVMQMPI